MAISVGLITQGLSLLTFILKKVWKVEKDNNESGKDKHAYVRGYVEAYLEKHALIIGDLDSFIADVIALLNKHNIFTKEV